MEQVEPATATPAAKGALQPAMALPRQPGHDCAMRPRTAFTVSELLVVLLLISATLSLAVPRFLSAYDLLGARAARDTLVALAARTRAVAVARGGADLVIDRSGTIELAVADDVVEQIDLARRYGVQLHLDHSTRSRIALHYDQLGVGRLTNATVRIARGTAEVGVTFSAYGRARSW